MTRQEKAVLREIIYSCGNADRNMFLGMGAGIQEVMGEDRKCCTMCGHCPSALANELKRLLGEELKR